MASKRTYSSTDRAPYSSRGPAKKRQAMGGAKYVTKTKTGARMNLGGTPLPAAWQPSGTEIKAIDIPVASYNFRAPATASSVILLNGVQTGAAFFNRVGSRVEMKNLHIRGVVTSAVTTVDTIGRLLILYDRQPTGALPVIADILLSRDQTGAVTTSGVSEINLDNRDRFIVVRDIQWFLPAVTNTAGVLTNGPQYSDDMPHTSINEFIKLKGLGTHYKSSSNPTTIGDIATGALYAAFVTTSDSAYAVAAQFRMRFEDK